MHKQKIGRKKSRDVFLTIQLKLRTKANIKSLFEPVNQTLFWVFLLFSLPLAAQHMDSKVGKNDTIIAPGIIIDGDTLAYFGLNTVYIRDHMLYHTQQERIKYYRLRQDVITVLPYARYAGIRYRTLQASLAQEKDKRKKRLLIKGVEEDIKKNYAKQLKNLTITQGRILIKLVDRETGQTSYEIVRQLKSGFSAFIFQGIAGFFGDNLRDKYDPNQDRDIEFIIQSTGLY